MTHYTVPSEGKGHQTVSLPVTLPLACNHAHLHCFLLVNLNSSHHTFHLHFIGKSSQGHKWLGCHIWFLLGNNSLSAFGIALFIKTMPSFRPSAGCLSLEWCSYSRHPLVILPSLYYFGQFHSFPWNFNYKILWIFPKGCHLSTGQLYLRRSMDSSVS